MLKWKTAVVAAGLSVALLGGVEARQQASQSTDKPIALTAQDYVDIYQLLHRYMFFLDSCEVSNNGYDFADLFTPDGYFITTNSSRPGTPGRWEGREALARLAGRQPDGSCSPGRVRGLTEQIHLNMGAIIDPTSDGAIGRSYLLMIEGPASPIRYAGWYEDVYVKTAAGWRFKSRNHVTDWSVLFDPRVPGYPAEGRGRGGARGRGEGQGAGGGAGAAGRGRQ
jgi:hypothetical protein